MMKSSAPIKRANFTLVIMLALAAFFALAVTTVNVPNYNAEAQVADEDIAAIEKRASAWWGVLGPDERINTVVGKDNDPNVEGHQIVAGGGTTVEALLAILRSNYDGNLQKADIDRFVDGNASDTNLDLYAVGDHIAGVKALRGFQSVELWWGYVSCAEARIAIGEDDGDLQTHDQDLTADGFQVEETAVCDATLNTAGDEVESTRPKPYSEVKDLVDKVGQAILGLDAPGTKNSADNVRAEQWWDSLNNCEKINALWGDGLSAGCQVGTPSQVTDPENPSLVNLAERPYNTTEEMTGLDADTKALVNDRWAWVYNNAGGANEDGTDDVVHWWDSMSCAMMRIAVGEDNEPVASDTLPNPGEFCSTWDGLNNTDPLTSIGKGRQEKVFKLGRAILFHDVDDNPIPDVAAWWDAVGMLPDVMIDGVTWDRRVLAVYGNPPMRDPYDDPDDVPDAGETVTTVTSDDITVFAKSYSDLMGGIEVDASTTGLDTHLPERITDILERNGFSVDTPTGVDTDNDNADDMWYYSAKGIVDALANEVFDPPLPIDDPYGGEGELGTGTDETIEDDEEFDWPYTPEGESGNKAATVGDWWQDTDCRVMRLVVGEDNDYLDAAVANTAPQGQPSNAVPNEESIYCGGYPGSGAMRIIGETAQQRVDKVGIALLGLSERGRPSFNLPATGVPTITGTAQVGSVLTAHVGDVNDREGDPNDADSTTNFNYQWYSGDEKVGTNASVYTVQPGDVGRRITVEVSFIDGARQHESVRSAPTTAIAGSPGKISRIEPTIRGVTVSAGDSVRLSVDIFGLQDVKDNGLSGTFEWSGENTHGVGTKREIDYTAPSSPGSYTVTAKLGIGDCQPKDEEVRASACSASINVKVRRPSAGPPPAGPPQNPPGEIPTILTDGAGNNYEVFTPEGGGVFTGEGFSFTAGAGVIPDGEYVGIRVSDEGSASNTGMTHQRYMLAGNRYQISAIDATNAAISSYELRLPATVCLSLPDELRANISELALVTINSDGSLTILSASVRLNKSDLSVCGNLSSLPATIAVGSAGRPDAIPTATPALTPIPPEAGGTAPTSSGVSWILTLGLAILLIGIVTAFNRRRKTGTET